MDPACTGGDCPFTSICQRFDPLAKADGKSPFVYPLPPFDPETNSCPEQWPPPEPEPAP